MANLQMSAVLPTPGSLRELEATIDSGTLAIVEGQLPRRALGLALEWAMIHSGELLEDWRLCRENTPPARIEPLA
jgi:hypothetical protein